MTRTTIALRIVIGVGLVLFAGGVGYAHRSPLALPSLTVGFTAAYIGGKARAWRAALAESPKRALAVQLPVAAMAQLVLVALLYTAGFGLGALVRGGVLRHPFTLVDAFLPVVVGVGAAALAFVIQRTERERSVEELMREFGLASDSDASVEDTEASEIRLVAGPVAPAEFYSGIHFTHGTYGPDGGFDSTPNAMSAGGDDKVAAAEARLGVALPEGLRALYQVQNGGSVASLCVPLAPESDVRRFKDIVNPFGGYDALHPTERLNSVFESVTEYASPDDPDEAHEFPPECRRLIVLAQWYRETLFLDYRRPGPPRVGYWDLDRGWDETDVRWWPDFAAFFASLRRYETV